MSWDVVIEIFGKVRDPEAIAALASEAADEGSIDWTEPVDESSFLELLTEAAEAGRALMLTRSDTGKGFIGVASACRDAGLSYVISSGPTGEDGYTDGCAWSPGETEEFRFQLAGEQPAIPIKEIRSHMENGLDTLAEFLETVETRSKAGKIELEPGFVEAYTAFVEIVDQPAP